MNLRRMTEEDFAFWAPRSKADYANSKARAERMTEAESLEAADKDWARLLPQDLTTPGHSFFVFSDDGETYGYAWYMMRMQGGEKVCFIYDVIIEKRYRGLGHGRTLMMELEKEAKREGAARMGLHVFANNQAAVKLYESLSYTPTNIVMEKRI